MNQKERHAGSDPASDLVRCYRILELAPGAGPSEIRAAYRDLAMIWHPDRLPRRNPRLRKCAEDRLKQINEAYERLMAAEPSDLADLRPKASGMPDAAAGALHPSGMAPAPARRVAPFLLSGLLAALAISVAAAAVRYVQLDRAQQEARRRLEISEAKKNTLLALTAHRTGSRQDPRPDSPRTAQRTGAAPSPGAAPPKEAPKSGFPQRHRSGVGPAASPQEEKIEAMIQEAEALTEAGHFAEAETRYREALRQIASTSDGSGGRMSVLRVRIERALSSEEIRLASSGYRRFDGRWYSPEVYRTEFVAYRDGRIHYSALKPAVEQIADPLVRTHLRGRFPGRIIHKNMVDCLELALLDNEPPVSRYAAMYRWEIWRFDGVHSGRLSVRLRYDAKTDAWEPQGLEKR